MIENLVYDMSSNFIISILGSVGNFVIVVRFYVFILSFYLFMFFINPRILVKLFLINK
jgi:hypothetical protein